MTNMELAGKIIQELVSTGVREFVLCAGARNSPLVNILDENRNLKVYSFLKNARPLFFALGRIASTRRPVAIITTSGTAVAELIPAAVEGTYSSLPLIMVTADRPKHYRGTGAPQTIEQVGIFSYYNEVALDVDAENSHVSFKSLSWKKPIHVNVCFEEPLIDGPVPKINFTGISEKNQTSCTNSTRNLEGDGKLPQYSPTLGDCGNSSGKSLRNCFRIFEAIQGSGILRGHFKFAWTSRFKGLRNSFGRKDDSSNFGI